jgi:hypothetical protein
VMLIEEVTKPPVQTGVNQVCARRSPHLAAPTHTCQREFCHCPHDLPEPRTREEIFERK